MALTLASQTLSPLPSVLSKGLVAVTFCGFLSFVASVGLFLYLTYRLISWRRQSGSQAPTNQFLFLIYNLLLADIQQAMAFLLNVASLRRDGVVVGTSECWAQGWFVSTGDLASSVFIFAIAVHTFFSVVRQYRTPSWLFYTCIAACWIFVYVMGIIGPVMYGSNFYVRAGAWCWVNEEYQDERLWLHYMWIFIAMFGSIAIYTVIYFYIRRVSPASSVSLSSHSMSHGATPMMLLYPFIYTLCTAPLAVGRIASMAGQDISLAYFCIAGSMIACNGWLDVLLYASTRREIVFSEAPPSEETGLETFAFLGKGHRMGTVTTVEAGDSATATHRHKRSTSRMTRRDLEHNESAENLYGLGQIGVKDTVKVTVERSAKTSGEWGAGGSSVDSLRY
ncbi:integral membrane protein [Phlyctema vagabunda]|uniref:Integral membrane protein n=1 Tax=Phlyctema vagabunda TaxID=108571 RepID=A0ABR4P866_9HELO